MREETTTSATDGTASTPVAAAPPKYRASIYTGPDATLPAEFVSRVQALEKVLAMPVWLLVHESAHDLRELDWAHLDSQVYDGFVEQRRGLKTAAGRIGLLIDSPGGSARFAYKLAKLLRNHAGAFTAIVPRFAKSAGTLLTLGADSIILAQDAELGPLDMQYFDSDREEYGSALNEVQALERLNADALRAVDSVMELFSRRMRKKTNVLLPVATAYVTQILGALFQKLDTVHFSQMARGLKEAEDYATRLLTRRYGEDVAASIAGHLVSDYPEHGFPIDPEEAASFGLVTIQPSPEEVEILDKLMPYLKKVVAIGRLEEVRQP